MAPSSPTPSFVAVVLALLAMGVMTGTQAMPDIHQARTLDITSSITIGRPQFGEELGPLVAGQQLKLTCSTVAPGPVSLSWWEGDEQLESSVHESKGIISSSFTINLLRIEDSGRRFTCQDKETKTKKHIELSVVPVRVLDITSSIKMGRPIFGDTLGPFTAGQPLTLTCSNEAAPGSVSLSWWEGEHKQESLVHEAFGIVSSSFTIKSLRDEDNGRHFTCQDQETETKRTIQIRVTPDTMDITKDDVTIDDGETVKGIAGEDFTLKCIVQGYNPSVGLWWEGETQLKATETKSTYATTNELSLKAVLVSDRGRRFTCRADNGQQAKTVTLAVDDEVFAFAAAEEYPGPNSSYMISLVVFSVALAVVILVSGTVVIYKCKISLSGDPGQLSTPSLVQRASDSVDEHTEKQGLV